MLNAATPSAPLSPKARAGDYLDLRDGRPPRRVLSVDGARSDKLFGYLLDTGEAVADRDLVADQVLLVSEVEADSFDAPNANS